MRKPRIDSSTASRHFESQFVASGSRRVTQVKYAVRQVMRRSLLEVVGAVYKEEFLSKSLLLTALWEGTLSCSSTHHSATFLPGGWFSEDSARITFHNSFI